MNDTFSQVKIDRTVGRTGNHRTFGAKNGKPPFHFQEVEKVWGRRFDRLIDFSRGL